MMMDMDMDDRDAGAATCSSSEECGEDYTEALPDVFVLSILAMLDAASLVRCQSVSRRWLRLGREQVLWRRLGRECPEFRTALEAAKRMTGSEPADWLEWCAYVTRKPTKSFFVRP